MPIGQKDRRQTCPGAILKNVVISIFSLKRRIFVYINEKLKDLWKILKMLRGSSPIFDFSTIILIAKNELVRQSL
jgi:hypothetical protein